MNRQNLRTQKVFKLFLFFLIIFTPSKTYAEDIRIYLNNEKLSFKVEPIIINGTTFVPMRDIFEKLDAEVNWNGNTQVVTGTKDKLVLKIDLPRDKISLNSKIIPMKKSSILKNSTTLVPLRVISESFNSEVLYEKNRNHSNIYIFSKDKNLIGSFVNDNIRLSPNMTKNDLIAKIGKPNRIDYYSENISLYVYNNLKYKNFIQVLVNDKGEILKIESNCKNWSIDNRVKVTGPYNENIESEYNKILKKSGYYLSINKSYDNKVSSISLESKNLPRELWYRKEHKHLDKIIRSKENQIFDLTNVIRVNNDLESLEKDTRLDALARNHSLDMAYNNFMAHENLSGLKGVDRFNNIKSNLLFGGENLCAGYLDPIDIVNALYNSKGHRANILNNSQYLGIGVGYNYNSKYKAYITQVYGRR